MIFSPLLCIPSAAGIDYADARETIGYGHLLISHIYAKSGGTFATQLSRELSPLLKEGKTWIDRTEKSLSTLPVAEIVPLIECLDMMHRICYGAMMPESVMEAAMQRVFSSLMKGDPTVNRVHLAKLIQRRLRTDARWSGGRMLEWYCDIISLWCDGMNPRHVSPGNDLDNTLQRLTVLLSESLYAQFGNLEDTVKKEWAERFAAIEIAALDSPTLRTYRLFLIEASRYLNPADALSLANEAAVLLADDDTLHPYERQALQMDLKNYRNVV